MCTTTSLNPAVTDNTLAALQCLRLLHQKYGANKWPNTVRDLRAFILTKEREHSLAEWMQRILQQNSRDPKHISKNRKTILRQLVDEWKRLGCLTGGSSGTAPVWNYHRVDELLRPCVYVPNKMVQPAAMEEVAGTAVTLGLPTQPQNNRTNSSTSTDRIQVVETERQLTAAIQSLSATESQLGSSTKTVHGRRVLAVDCEGVPENLFLIQICAGTSTFVFDCVKLDPKQVCNALEGILTDPATIKLFHDLHKDAAALGTVGGLSKPLAGTLDSQLVMELLTGELYMGFNKMMEKLELPLHPLKSTIHQRLKRGGAPEVFETRPLSRDAIDYAVVDVSLLLKATSALMNAAGDNFKLLQVASDARAAAAARTGGGRQLGFDVSNSYAMASLELLQTCKPDSMLDPTPLKVSNDVPILLDLLPADLAKHLQYPEVQKELSEIVMDKGRQPMFWSSGTRALLSDRIVNDEDIATVVNKLGGFGGDNRAGLEQQLHRVSAIRNRQQDIIGLTMRVGRHISGNATMIADLLFSDPTKSILFLGEPGSGKTTIVRETTRLLAERSNVVIVDTSNEIAGDGDIVHPCVGLARRMMVPSLQAQGKVMIECVQNHTPEIMVIDEIGRPEEVEAAKTCKQRGVRLVASAHGDLRKLTKNTKLRGLVGGVESVIVGDAMAKEEMKKRNEENPQGGGSSLRKLLAQRAGSPVFDVIVELRRGAHHEWRIVLDTATAVDRILEGKKYHSQLRIRDPITGGIHLELEEA